ncbi:MAG TPA: response regulator [Candidatus Dormibacteraeota bacterium]|nr:response regulator [Candidatus Dormibacteraeota bacterium]
MALAVVVDDSAADRKLAETLLKHAGHTVLSSDDGLAGLELIKKEKPDLIITDLITPTIDGYDLARAVRGDPATASTPIIMVTAHYLEPEVRRLAAQMRIQHVLIKPFEPQAFLDAVDNALLEKAVLDLDVNPVPGEFHIGHLRLVSAKLYEKVTELDIARREFEATASKYRLLFRAHPEPMWVYNVETLRFLEVNDAAIRQYGYSRDEFMAMTVKDLIPPESMTAYMENIGKIHEEKRSVPRQARKKDGTVIDVEVSTRDLGHQTRYVMAQDVTQTRKAQLQLHQAQRMESLGQLAGGVAHDFNNLLGVILNFSWFVKANLTAEVEGGDGERWRPVLKDMERIERAAENAARLTHQLLAFARVDVVQPKPMNINSAVAEMEPLLRRTIGEHIDLIAHPGPDLWPVLIDSSQLSQVVTNLVINSRDAMTQGGTLTIDAENLEVDAAFAAPRAGLNPGRYVRLRVSDTGNGMNKETLKHVFEPFFTTKPRGQGTGLGLATTYGIVKQAGGYIDVYSEPGIGTRVSVLLPATDQAQPAAQPAASEPAPAASETVLVVEDSDDLREIVDRILTKSGYQVMIAANGPDALDMAREFTGHIDLLLTDVIMPQMNGSELAPRLIASRPDLRVLYMSGFAQPALGATGTLEPGTALLDKPFTEPALLASVREALAVKP